MHENRLLFTLIMDAGSEMKVQLTDTVPDKSRGVDKELRMPLTC